jgi:hypothetical protein
MRKMVLCMGMALFVMVASVNVPSAVAQPHLKIFWYADGEETSYSGSIREFLEGKGYTVTYRDDGPTYNVWTSYSDYDVVVAEHTCGGGTLTGLQQWFQAGKGYVALLGGNMYNDSNDAYIMGLLNVDADGRPNGLPYESWTVSQLYWVDSSHALRTYPNSDWSINSISSGQNNYRVAITNGQNVVEYASGKAAMQVREGVEEAGRIVYLGSNYHSPGHTTIDVRKMVENMIVWAAFGGPQGVQKPTKKTASLMPLAQTNLAQANNLLAQANDLLSQAKEKNLDAGTCEKLINEATELLKEAKKVAPNSVYANNLALQAIAKLKQAIDCLKTLVG